MNTSPPAYYSATTTPAQDHRTPYAAARASMSGRTGAYGSGPSSGASYYVSAPSPWQRATPDASPWGGVLPPAAPTAAESTETIRTATERQIAAHLAGHAAAANAHADALEARVAAAPGPFAGHAAPLGMAAQGPAPTYHAAYATAVASQDVQGAQQPPQDPRASRRQTFTDYATAVSVAAASTLPTLLGGG